MPGSQLKFETNSLREFITAEDVTTRGSIEHLLAQILSAIRRHLEMDVAFVSEFRDGRRYFRNLNSGSPDQPIREGNSDLLEETYCQRVADGRLPEIIHDAGKDPVAKQLEVTHQVPVGAHMAVPIRLSDGSIYGTLCCFSFEADPTLNDRDLSVMRIFADLAADSIETEIQDERSVSVIEERIKKVLTGDALSMVYQPIYSISNGKIYGYEALTRFSGEPYRPPNIWFDEAYRIGLGSQLEMKSIHEIIKDLQHFPNQFPISINTSPHNIMNGSLNDAFQEIPMDRLILEITEHQSIDNYDELKKTLRGLRDQGLKIAIDDAGAGYASFRHILKLEPDIIKIDMSISRNIDINSRQRAIACAYASLAQEMGCLVLAEGIETEAELDTYRELGVPLAQGYLLGKPMPIEAWL